MNNSQRKIQDKWKKGFVLGLDCITYSNGKIIIGSVYRTENPNNGEIKQYWSPICDTELEKIEKYDDDIWTEYDIFHGSFEYENQKIVFGDGGMGNEGYIASTKLNGELNWSIFFTFSNPISKAEIIENRLVCYGHSGTIINIDLNELSKIKVDYVV
ncbi:hypothetical protein [uncultured Winogradskyella sp.]|uniref:hypothetical protein n=1 Tax=uncultured Winogradskyella sp. TaxID=395353 RepID=UPI002629283B|nr:hypothetical protein [uncultured Winogradskyella sp.]